MPLLDPGIHLDLNQLVGDAFFEFGKHIVSASATANRQNTFVTGTVRDGDEATEAIALATRAMTEVPEIDPAIGGDDLRAFLQSTEARHIVKELFVCNLAQASHRERALVQAEFTETLGLWTGLKGRKLETTGSRLFETLVAKTSDALNMAIRDSDVAAHEAKSAARHHVLRDSITNIDRNLMLLANESQVSVQQHVEFAHTLREQVRKVDCHIMPPSLDSHTPHEVETLFVPMGFHELGADLTPRGASKTSLTYDDLTATMHRVVVLGDPGGGKSTFAVKVCHDIAEAGQTQRGQRTPILVRCRDYAERKTAAGKGLTQFLCESVSSKYQLPEPEHRTIAYLLRNGRLTVILDGLDELTDVADRRWLARDIEAFAAQYPLAPMVVTSRAVGYEQAHLDSAQFNSYLLERLSDLKVEELAARYLAISQGIQGNALKQILRSFLDESDAVQDLRTNPLMLGLLCNIYRGPGSIPEDRPGIFQKCSELLYNQWDLYRGMKPEVPFESQLRPMLWHLADWIHGNAARENGVSESALTGEATEFLLGRRFEDQNDAREAARQFVRLCTGRYWVFSDVGSTESEGIYSFTHRTFLEFFAAEGIAQGDASAVDVIRSRIDRIADVEDDVVSELVVQMVAGRLESGADVMLNVMWQEATVRTRSEALAVLEFGTRCLGFLVPAREVLQVGVSAAVGAICDLDLADQQSIAEKKWRNAMVRNLMRAHGECAETVRTATLESIACELGSEAVERRVVAAELLLSLPAAAELVARSDSATWGASTIHTVKKHADDLKVLSGESFAITYELARLGIVSAGHIVDHGRMEWLIRDRRSSLCAGDPVALAVLGLRGSAWAREFRRGLIDAVLLADEPGGDEVGAGASSKRATFERDVLEEFILTAVVLERFSEDEVAEMNIEIDPRLAPIVDARYGRGTAQARVPDEVLGGAGEELMLDWSLRKTHLIATVGDGDGRQPTTRRWLARKDRRAIPPRS